MDKSDDPISSHRSSMVSHNTEILSEHSFDMVRGASNFLFSQIKQASIPYQRRTYYKYLIPMNLSRI